MFMPMSDCKKAVLATAASLFLLSSTGAQAFDPEKVFQGNDEPHSILRYGYDALKDGRFEEAIGAFTFGAERDHVASQWKLARMLQIGDGGHRDDLAAYKLYLKIAKRFSDQPPSRSELAYVSSAITALGAYHLSGIKGSPIKPNASRAEGYFYRAAALYLDADAQYQLGKLYRGDRLGKPRPRSAVRWLGLSAKKGHALAQAELGEMLFYGEGVKRNAVRGLVFMTRATANSARQTLSNIRARQLDALTRASEAQRQAARKIIESLDLRPKVEEGGYALDLELNKATSVPAAQSD